MKHIVRILFLLVTISGLYAQDQPKENDTKPRSRVDISEIVIRHVKVNRIKTPQEMIDALGSYNGHVTKELIATMPRKGKDDDDIFFFRVKWYISVTKLAAEYKLRGLKPDPYAQIQVNINDPSFAEEYPNASQWGFNNGKASFILMDQWDFDQRHVSVNRNDGGWDGRWWFAGVRK